VYLCKMQKMAHWVLFFFLLTISMVGYTQTPTVGSKTIVFNNIYCNQLDISWTSGNGANRIVLARKGAAMNAYPIDNLFYSGNDTFGKGTKLGADIYTIYRGSGNSTSVKNLEANTTYYFAIFEYNSSGSVYNYLTSVYPEASVTTENIIANFGIDNDYQCVNGNFFKFTNSSSNTLNNTMTYSWDFGDANKSIAKDPTHSYAYGNVFNVKLEVTSIGCFTSVVKRDTVVSPPITNFYLDSITGSDSVSCLRNNNYKFRNSTIVPPIAGTNYDETGYFWTFGDGTFSSGFNALKKYTIPGTYEVKLVTRRKITEDSIRPYCYDSLSKSYTILVPPLAAGKGKIVLSDTALCLNGNVFNFSHTASNITTSWWYFGNMDSLQGNPVNYSYSAPGKYYIRLDVVDDRGCSDFAFDSLQIYTKPNNFFTGLKPAYCIGDPKAFMKPNLYGGVFYGKGINAADSSFTPDSLGTYDIIYVYKQGDCADTAKYTVTVNDRPYFTLGSDSVICDVDKITLNIENPAGSYLWVTGEKTQSIVVATPGNYWGEADDGKCKFRDTVKVTQISPPKFELGRDSTLCGGNVVELNVTSDMATYSWNDGTSSAQKEVAVSGSYAVTVTNKCGSFYDSVNIEIEPFACTIFIPNAFSPNRDGQNERFIPLGNYRLIGIRIYDRWGRKLYDSPSKDGWDGKEDGEVVPMGVYFFIVEYMIAEGPNYSLKQVGGPLHVVY
jgi:gliding motility-associated-like protein